MEIILSAAFRLRERIGDAFSFFVLPAGKGALDEAFTISRFLLKGTCTHARTRTCTQRQQTSPSAALSLFLKKKKSKGEQILNMNTPATNCTSGTPAP